MFFTRPQHVYHLAQSSLWSGNEHSYLPPTHAADGFIHCAAVANSLVTIANCFYKGVEGEFVCEWMRDGAIEARTFMHSAPCTHMHTHLQITCTFWMSLSRATSTSSGTLGQLLVILCLTAAHVQRARVHQATHAARCVQTHVLCMHTLCLRKLCLACMLTLRHPLTAAIIGSQCRRHFDRHAQAARGCDGQVGAANGSRCHSDKARL